MDFIKTLDLLKDWKQLPSYRAEPRVDFIVVGALPEIMKYHFNDEVDLIIPELPIRIGSIDEKNSLLNKSFKVDFYVLLKSGRNIFIEFKTDSKSRRDKQDKYLIASREVGMKNILDGIIKINDATESRYKHKYAHLIDKLTDYDLLEKKEHELSVICKNDVIDILYIQPKSKNDYEIGFEKVSELMLNSNDRVYQHFGEILKSWSNN